MEQGIGERLRARARELQLTDAEVARRLGLAQSRYAHYVSGTRAPDYRTLARICRTLLTSPDHLLGFSADSPGPSSEGALLRERALASLAAMDLGSLRLAADILDAIARRSGDGERPGLQPHPDPVS